MTNPCKHEIGPWPGGQQWPRCLKCEIERLEKVLTAAHITGWEQWKLTPSGTDEPSEQPKRLNPAEYGPQVIDCPCGVCVYYRKQFRDQGTPLEEYWTPARRAALKASDIQSRPLYTCAVAGCPGNHLSRESVCVGNERRCIDCGKQIEMPILGRCLVCHGKAHPVRTNEQS